MAACTGMDPERLPGKFRRESMDLDLKKVLAFQSEARVLLAQSESPESRRVAELLLAICEFQEQHVNTTRCHEWDLNSTEERLRKFEDLRN
jgi:hypothetical protein